MEPIWYAIVWIAVGAIGAFFASRIAGNKGHSPALFGIIGFVLPLIGIIIAAVLPKKA